MLLQCQSHMKTSTVTHIGRAFENDSIDRLGPQAPKQQFANDPRETVTNDNSIWQKFSSIK